MLEIQLVFAATLVVLSTSQAFFPLAGRCKEVASIQTDKSLLSLRQWYCVYYPDDESLNTVDSDYEDFSVTPKRRVHGVHRIRMKDNSILPYVYKYSVGSDNVLREEVFGDNGEKQVFRIYKLHHIPGENAFLCYRCSETGGVDYDTRFIAMPRGSTLGSTAEQRLLDIDASYNFTGRIKKLDNKLVW